MIMLVDSESGKILEDRVLIIGKNPYLLDKNFTKVFVCFLKDVVDNKVISGKALRLLMYMVTKMEYNTKNVYLSCEEAMRELNISRRTFYQWIASLVKERILERVGTNLYRLREYTAVKGSEYIAHTKSFSQKVKKK